MHLYMNGFPGHIAQPPTRRVWILCGGLHPLNSLLCDLGALLFPRGSFSWISYLLCDQVNISALL
jgi:hypothetical protein